MSGCSDTVFVWPSFPYMAMSLCTLNSQHATLTCFLNRTQLLSVHFTRIVWTCEDRPGKLSENSPLPTCLKKIYWHRNVALAIAFYALEHLFFNVIFVKWKLFFIKKQFVWKILSLTWPWLLLNKSILWSFLELFFGRQNDLPVRRRIPSTKEKTPTPSPLLDYRPKRQPKSPFPCWSLFSGCSDG